MSASNYILKELLQRLFNLLSLVVIRLTQRTLFYSQTKGMIFVSHCPPIRIFLSYIIHITPACNNMKSKFEVNFKLQVIVDNASV